MLQFYFTACRVNYDFESWARITDELRSNVSTINRVNRAQIVDDALNLAKAGILDYETALAQTYHFDMEMDFIPWSAAMNALSYLKLMLSVSPFIQNILAMLVSGKLASSFELSLWLPWHFHPFPSEFLPGQQGIDDLHQLQDAAALRQRRLRGQT